MATSIPNETSTQAIARSVCGIPDVAIVAKQTTMNVANRAPEILAPFDKRELEGITILPRVFEMTMPENLRGFGRILERPSASLAEYLTSVGVIALIAKQNAPANGLSNAPIVAPCTLLPTLA